MHIAAKWWQPVGHRFMSRLMAVLLSLTGLPAANPAPDAPLNRPIETRISFEVPTDWSRELPPLCRPDVVRYRTCIE